MIWSLPVTTRRKLGLQILQGIFLGKDGVNSRLVLEYFVRKTLPCELWQWEDLSDSWILRYVRVHCHGFAEKRLWFC